MFGLFERPDESLPNVIVKLLNAEYSYLDKRMNYLNSLYLASPTEDNRKNLNALYKEYSELIDIAEQYKTNQDLEIQILLCPTFK